MRRSLSFVTIFLALNCAVDAQQRGKTELDAFTGNWKGTAEINDESLHAELQCYWILSESFQQWDLLAYRSGREAYPHLQERLIIGIAGVERFSVYRFDNSGVSWWGVREGKGKHWQHEFDASDGSRESGILEWESPKTFSIITTIMDDQGNVRSTVRFHFKR